MLLDDDRDENVNERAPVRHEEHVIQEESKYKLKE